MPAWLTISLTDLNDYLVGAQVTALNSSALAPGQTDRFTKVMTDMVNRIRAKIEGCPRNHISATPLTVPPELKWAACYLIIEAMQAGVPGLKLTDDQRNQIVKAGEQLTRIADCKGGRQHPQRSAHTHRRPARRADSTRHPHPAPRFAPPNPRPLIMPAQ